MRVVSLNVGVPRSHQWRGKEVVTAIFKSPVTFRSAVRKHNIAGDAQADLTVHGGKNKAVYAYPSEHYEFWKAELPGVDLSYGMFGENLTTEGLIETDTCVGDEFRVGTSRLVVTQPRMPCFKLGVRFDDAGMVKRFLAARRPGIYFAVVEEGHVAPGDTMECVRRNDQRVSVTDVVAMTLGEITDPASIRRVLSIEALADSVRADLESRLADN